MANYITNIIYLRWKFTERVEIFSSLSRVYKKYDNAIMGVAKSTLYKKDLFHGWKNGHLEIKKIRINEDEGKPGSYK